VSSLGAGAFITATVKNTEKIPLSIQIVGADRKQRIWRTWLFKYLKVNQNCKSVIPAGGMHTQNGEGMWVSGKWCNKKHHITSFGVLLS
jgi:hypothetical protein